jgi:hypothetical protein
MNSRISIPFTILSIVFCLCFIIDSFLELKVVNIYGIPVTAGFLVITISYIVSDCLVEVYGYSKARLVMWLTFVAHAITVSLLQIACWLPSAEYWEGEQHFQFIFGLTPRITIASMIAFVVGSSTNAYVMSRMKVSCKLFGFKFRAFMSTVAGESIDSLTFFPMAFYGLLPLSEIVTMIFVQATGKIIYESLVLPITSRVVVYVKKWDHTDTYDNQVSYNLFSFKSE